MQRALWTAAAGMAVQQTNLDVISNNLANVNTTGFKRSRAEFQDLLYQTLIAPGTASSASTTEPVGVQIGLGAKTGAVKKIFQVGDYKPTENPFDWAIQGEGFFKVTKPDGTLVYTRDGSFTVNENGNIVTKEGYLIDPPITVPPDMTALTVSKDGTVSARLADNTISQIGTIEIARFMNSTGLVSLGGNYYAPSPASGDATLGTPGTDGMGEISQNFLETSNVSIVTELVDLITAQRAYELNSRAVRASDEMLQQIAQLVR